MAVVVVGVGVAGKKTKLEMLIANLMVPKGKDVKLNKNNFYWFITRNMCKTRYGPNRPAADMENLNFR